MTKTEEIKNKLGPDGVVERKQDPANMVKTYLKQMENEIAKALPKHITAERMSRIVLTTIRQTPALLQCSVESLLGAVMQASQLGLEPGLLGHCYLIPYKGQVQFQMGYQGLIDLCRRSGELAQITVQTIFEQDDFYAEYGSKQQIKHIPKLSDRGRVIGYYCFTKLKNGEESFTIMSVKDVEKHRDHFSKSKKEGKLYGPWVDSFDSMAKKTVAKQHLKFVPLSVEIRQSLEQDETVKENLYDDPVKMVYPVEEEPLSIEEQEKPNHALNFLKNIIYTAETKDEVEEVYRSIDFELTKGTISKDEANHLHSLKRLDH